MKVLSVVLLTVLCVSCASATVERNLIDLDMAWQNPYDCPVDQISIQVRGTERMIVLNLMYDPYVTPQSIGMFSATLSRAVYNEVFTHGFRVVNARTH